MKNPGMRQALTSIDQLCAMTGAIADGIGALAISGFATDSRQVEPGDVFIALRGEHHDGHHHVQQAASRGALAALVSQPVAGAGEITCLTVADTGVALGLLASMWRQCFSLPCLAVAGSNGKTTVKGMLASILAAEFGEQAVLATRANDNNGIGVAQTLLRLRDYHRGAVVEIGSNHPGEIAPLALMVRPDVAVITNAQRDHQAHFQSVTQTALENASLLSALLHDGIAVLPADDAFLPRWRGVAGQRSVLTFGYGSNADVWLHELHTTPSGSRFNLRGRESIDDIHLYCMGRHNALNAAAAAAAALAAGISADSIRRGLGLYAPAAGRLRRRQCSDGLQIIDDSYNANPDSMMAALDVLAAQPGPRWAVLGDMGECGERAPQFHKAVGRHAQQLGIDRVLTLGAEAPAIASASGASGLHCTDPDTLLLALSDCPPTATVLVKGSRHMRMERVIEALLQARRVEAAGLARG